MIWCRGIHLCSQFKCWIKHFKNTTCIFFKTKMLSHFTRHWKATVLHGHRGHTARQDTVRHPECHGICTPLTYVDIANLQFHSHLYTSTQCWSFTVIFSVLIMMKGCILHVKEDLFLIFCFSTIINHRRGWAGCLYFTMIMGTFTERGWQGFCLDLKIILPWLWEPFQEGGQQSFCWHLSRYKEYFTMIMTDISFSLQPLQEGGRWQGFCWHLSRSNHATWCTSGW